MNFYLDWEDVKEMGSGWEASNRGRRLFKIFPPKEGDYLRGEINQGAAIIQGNTVF